MAVRLGHPPKMQQIGLYVTTEPCSMDVQHQTQSRSQQARTDGEVQHRTTRNMLRANRLSWYGHVERSSGWINRCRSIKVPRTKGPGRPKKTWDETVQGDTEKPGNWWMQTHKTAPFGDIGCVKPRTVRLHVWKMRRKPGYVRMFVISLTLNMWGPSYLGLTRSISWLMMPWLLTSPGHQQPWYWLYRICRPCSYLRKDFKYLCQINVEEWHKM